MLRPLLLAVLLVVVTTCSASIEKEPVRVTSQNSGPRYDLDDVGRISLAEGEASNNVDNSNNNNNIKPAVDNPSRQQQPADNDPSSMSPIGHLSIRRIFLIPMMGPMSDEESPSNPSERVTAQEPPREPPSSLFWPFMAPRQPPVSNHHHHHLLGQDEASRGPPRRGGEVDESMPGMTAAASGERESMDRPPQRPLFDPLQMMLEMMHHALSNAGNPMADAPPQESNNPFFTDLNKDASTPPKNGPEGSVTDDMSGTSLERPIKPQSKNETKEDIVEIEGRKYLRKTVISRHVGENIVFMTKRLIFVPLNETGGNDEATTIPSATTTTVLPKEPVESSSSDEEKRVKPVESEPTSTTATPLIADSVANSQAPGAATTSESNPTAAVSPSSTAPVSVEEATTTTASSVTPAKESWVERVSEAIESRLMEKNSEEVPATTSAPSTTNKPEIAVSA